MTTAHQGTVCKKALGHYVVHTNGRIVDCELSTRLNRELVYPIADPTSFRRRVMDVRKIQQIDPVAVGDNVSFIDSGASTGLITEVLPRRSRLARSQAAFEQVIAANLDQVVPVFAALQPPPVWNLLDRYLASAESMDLPSLVCITKHDLAEDDSELQDELAMYRRIGYRTIVTSATSGEGLDELREALRGRLSVLIGKSGVGKTTLLNALHPGLGHRVAAVSETTGKGRHTTSNLEMVPLDDEGDIAAGAVIDTPGMREFGLWEVDGSDLALLFLEMRPFVGACKFGLDCRHVSEPGCAIQRVMADGIISRRRYESYLKLLNG